MGRFSNLDFNEPQGNKGLAKELSQDPWPNQDAESCMQRADQFFYRGEYEPALTTYSRALRFDKNLVQAWAGQVRSLLRLNEVPEAATWSNRALEKFPNTPELLALRGLALILDHNADEGIEFLDGAVEQKSPGYWAWINRGEGLLAGAKTVQNAERCLLKAQELAPEDPNVWLQCGYIWNHYHQGARARLALLEAIRLDESNPYSLFECGWAYEKLGDKGAAGGYYERALALRSGHWAASEGLGRVRRRGILGLLKR